MTISSVRAGQEWELVSATSDDPLVLKVVEVLDDGHAAVQMFRRSQPTVMLGRSQMWHGEISSAGVLVGGPGALDAARRRKRADELAQLLRYAATQHLRENAADDDDVRFDGTEVAEIVARNENVGRDQARAMLRDALGELGGSESTSPYNDEVTYVIPIKNLKGTTS